MRPTQASKYYGNLPLTFEVNHGQVDPQEKFLSRGSGYSLFLTPAEAVLTLSWVQGSGIRGRGNTFSKSYPRRPEPQHRASAVVRMKLVNANPDPEVVGLDELPGKSNYFIGNDPMKWRTNVPHYAKVRYSNVYAGVDLIYYGDRGKLEYDFFVAPGVDPRVIKLAFEGAKNMRVEANGDLELGMTAGNVRLHKPVVYQEVDGRRKLVAGGYTLKGNHRVGFEVADYDESRPLVIDPVLTYSTYLGGAGKETGYAISVDSSGNAYVTGSTFSSAFPTAGPIQAATAGGLDAFVTKLNPEGSALVYSTYLGGGEDDKSTLVVTKVENIPAGERKSQLLTQYFTSLVGQDRSSGYIKVTADKGMASFALFGTNDLSVLSAVPPQLVP